MRKVLAILAMIAFCCPIALYAWVHNPGVFDGRTHLRYMAWGNPEQNATDKELLARFEQQHPDIKVDYTLVPPVFYYQKLQIALLAGTAPDVFRMDLYNLPKYFPYGYFKPLDELAKDDPTFHAEDFYPQARREVTYNGKMQGVNTLFGGLILYYNKKLVRAAHLEDPYLVYQRGAWTFDTMVAYAQAMTIRKNGTVTQYGLSLERPNLWWIIWAFGGEIITVNGDVSVDQPEAIAGIRFFNDLDDRWHVVPRPGEATGGTFSFESGNLGMTSGFAGESPRYRRLMPGNDWDIVPLPRRDLNTPAVSLLKGNGLLASARTRHAREAWLLMSYLTSPEAELAYYGPKLRRCIPTRISVAHDPAYLRDDGRPPFNTGTFQFLYDTGRELPVTSYWQEWQPFYVLWLDRLALKNCTVEECANGLAADLRRVVREAQQ